MKPDLYERARGVLRTEPFLQVRGRLQKDGDTLNLIALTVEALRPAGHGPDAPLGEEPAPLEGSLPGSPFRFLRTLRQTPPEAKNFA